MLDSIQYLARLLKRRFRTCALQHCRAFNVYSIHDCLDNSTMALFLSMTGQLNYKKWRGKAMNENIPEKCYIQQDLVFAPCLLIEGHSGPHDWEACPKVSNSISLTRGQLREKIIAILTNNAGRILERLEIDVDAIMTAVDEYREYANRDAFKKQVRTEVIKIVAQHQADKILAGEREGHNV